VLVVISEVFWGHAKGTAQPNPPSDALNVEPIHTLRDTVAHSELPPSQGYILVDRQSFQLTANLEETLRRLRSQNDELAIWIDAVCIDQSNARERNESVRKK